MKYFVYFLRCEDNSLYIGTTNNVEKRYQAHIEGRGAKYTQSHPVERLECFFSCESQGEALRLEYCLKQLSKKKKEEFLGEPSLALAQKIYEKIKIKKESVKKIKRKQKNI